MSPPLPLLLVILLAGVLASAAASTPAPPPCSRSCAALNCDSVGIRYGKYCGVGWSGCDGEEPCDDLDACCRDHDHCVDKKGCVAMHSFQFPSHLCFSCSFITLYQALVSH
uniref:PLA21 n=1 Tax=Arundo donax TaxID=35708 RepID=A0A0A9DVB1_ARUDO